MPRKSNTRAAHGSGTIRQRPDGRWEARFFVNGQRKSVYGATQKEARQKLTAATSDVDNGVYMQPTHLTLDAWADIWKKTYLTDVKPGTLHTYTYIMGKYLRPALGKIKLAALTAPAIQTVYNKLLKDGLSPKYIRDIHGVLHRCLSDAVAVGYLRANPADACKLPKKAAPQLAPFDEAQIGAFLAAIQGHRMEAVFYVTLFTGLRQGEVLGLTWGAVDFKRGRITVDKQLQRSRDGSGTYTLATPKNSKARHITPAPSVMAVLKHERAIQAQRRLMAGPAWSNPLDLVFTNELGHCLNPHTVYLNFKAIAADIGAPAARFHDLRHSYAVLAIRSGDDILTVQRNLGHHSAAFTLDVYGFITEQMKQESAARMEAQIRALKQA